MTNDFNSIIAVRNTIPGHTKETPRAMGPSPEPTHTRAPQRESVRTYLNTPHIDGGYSIMIDQGKYMVLSYLYTVLLDLDPDLYLVKYILINQS